MPKVASTRKKPITNETSSEEDTSLRRKTPKVASTRKKQKMIFFTKSRTSKVVATRKNPNTNETSSKKTHLCDLRRLKLHQQQKRNTENAEL